MYNTYNIAIESFKVIVFNYNIQQEYESIPLSTSVFKNPYPFCTVEIYVMLNKYIIEVF